MKILIICCLFENKKEPKKALLLSLNFNTFYKVITEDLQWKYQLSLLISIVFHYIEAKGIYLQIRVQSGLYLHSGPHLDVLGNVSLDMNLFSFYLPSENLNLLLVEMFG